VDGDERDANTPVAKEILDHFLRNPEAADSLLEIARWRLMQEKVQRTVNATQAAVNLLVAEGYLQQETRLGSGQIFQLNPNRRRAAESFVSGSDLDRLPEEQVVLQSSDEAEQQP
jgi:hypothetical protein